MNWYRGQLNHEAFGHVSLPAKQPRDEGSLPLTQIPPGSHIMRPFPVGVAIDLKRGVIIHE